MLAEVWDLQNSATLDRLFESLIYLSSKNFTMTPSGLFSILSWQRQSVSKKWLDRSFAPRID